MVAYEHVKQPRAPIGLDWLWSQVLHFSGKAQLQMFDRTGN